MFGKIKMDQKTAPIISAVVALLMGSVFVVGVLVGQNGLLEFEFDISNQTTETKLPDDLNYDSVERIYDLLRQQYDGQLSEEQLLEGLKSGLVGSVNDPYTEYLNSVQAEQFFNSLEGTFSGIGAQLGKQDDRIIIIAPLDGFPAASAGLRSLDRIVAVDGQNIDGLSLTEVVSLIRGQAGTDVVLTINRNDQADNLDVTITRDIIDLPSVNSVIDGDIGIIRVVQFSDDTTSLTEKAAREFIEAGVKGVVLDLRNNPGGYLDEAVTLSNLWLDKDQAVVHIRSSSGEAQTEKTTNQGLLFGVPTVVLINQGSASASEIVAGALQDHQVAVVVGQQSFGKGSVQTLEELENSGELLKLTTSHWFTPNNRGVDKIGITPDTKVEMSHEEFLAGDDKQLQSAKTILRQ